MRTGRVMELEAEGVYHCSSKTVNGENLFSDIHLRVFRDMLRRVADFSGVSVITYCLLENHFHLLVRIGPVGAISDKELVRRYRRLYSEGYLYQALTAEDLAAVLDQGGVEAARIRRALVARMGNVSEFMKTLKQRFTLWFNGNHRRFGPLWSDRFKSVLIEDNVSVIETVAAYIDLNPVRAGNVVHPKDSMRSGFGRAAKGERFERDGIALLYGRDPSGFARYCKVLNENSAFSCGAEEGDSIKGPDASGRVPHRPRRTGRFLSVLRHFSNGKVFGSKEFVERMFDEFSVFREVVTRRRSPIAVPNMSGLYSGTRVRRAKTCKKVRLPLS